MTPGQDDTPEAPELDPAGIPAPAKPSPARWVVVALGAVALLAGVLIVSERLPGWLTQSDGPPTASEDIGGSGDVEARRIQATLFYVSEDGLALVPTGRNVLYGETPVEQARRLIEAQIADAPPGLVSAIPSGTTVRAVYLTDSQEAYVDLGGAIATGHPGGSLDEALTVYTIVNALTVNLPEVTAVQILIDGREVDSLRGHIDLRAPIARASGWIQTEKGTSTE
jgi:hypothetical protein